jgi:hypothetical protein
MEVSETPFVGECVTTEAMKANEFNKMPTDCLFCRIAKRDSDAHVIHEDAALMAFLVLCPI